MLVSAFSRHPEVGSLARRCHRVLDNLSLLIACYRSSVTAPGSHVPLHRSSLCLNSKRAAKSSHRYETPTGDRKVSLCGVLPLLTALTADTFGSPSVVAGLSVTFWSFSKLTTHSSSSSWSRMTCLNLGKMAIPEGPGTAKVDVTAVLNGVPYLLVNCVGGPALPTLSHNRLTTAHICSTRP